MINHWTMVDRGGGLYYSTNTMWIRWMYSVLIIFHMIASTKMDLSKPNDIHCPSLTVNSACPCYKFDDGKFLFSFLFLYTHTIQCESVIKIHKCEFFGSLKGSYRVIQN